MSKTLFYTVIFTVFYVAVFSLGVDGVVAEDSSSPAKALQWAHAHNDYEHPRPLFDALDNGFCSVEADIFLKNETLLVAHTALQLKPERTLESLYLEPLRNRAKKFNGEIFPDADIFYLWIDIKTEASSTYAVLKKLLEKYADILTRYENDKVIPGAVTVILTGNANVNLIRNEPIRYAGVDGARAALNSDESADLIPAIGLSWRNEFPQFKGSLTSAEQEKLTEQVRKVHEKGRKVRYWAAPDNEAFWKIMYDADVDWINTDRLKPLRQFLSEQQ
jgi:glycerophosphoryl diester phosphodiesterase